MNLRTPITAFTIMTFVAANHFLYWLQKMPGIGDLVPESVYAREELKKFVAVLMGVFKALIKFIFAGAYVAIGVALPASDLGAGAVGVPAMDSFVHVLLVLSIVAGPLISPVIFEPRREKFMLVQLMRLDPGQYLSSIALFRALVDLLCFLIILPIAAALLGGTLLDGVVLAVLIPCARLMGEALNLYVYSKRRFVMSRNLKLVGALCAAFLAAAYVPLFLGMPLPLGEVLTDPLAIVPFALGAVPAFRYIVRYRKYPEIAIDTIKGMDFTVDPDKRMIEARFASVKLREADFSSEVLSSHKYDKLEGYAYLNAIFYGRHKRQLTNPMLIRLAAVGVLFSVAVLLSQLLPAGTFDIGLEPRHILPVFVPIMYLASMGERATRAMFYNCDLALLRYPFYRQKDAVLSNFTVRLKMVAGLNLVVAAAISVAVVAAQLILGWDWPLLSIGSFVLTILVLSLFFSTHYLFLYYVFQPYTADLGMKNPFFQVINTAVCMASILAIQIDSPPSYFTLVVIGLTVAYILVALFLVHRYAPKTFRVK